MNKPRLLDGCCHAGGLGKGYADAGFEVVGVDIEPQPHYPYEFVQADILDVLADRDFLASFDALHVSPTCQHDARVTAWRGSRDDHPDLLGPVLKRLDQVELPWIVENVPEAVRPGRLRADYMLCGTQFGLKVRRHRAFQVGNWTPPFELQPPCHCYRNRDLMAFGHKDERAYANAMGCTWMSAKEARQAVPPAYAEYIGRHLVAELERQAAA